MVPRLFAPSLGLLLIYMGDNKVMDNLKIVKLEDDNDRLIEVVKFLSEESFECYNQTHLENNKNLNCEQMKLIKTYFLKAQYEKFMSFNGCVYSAYIDDSMLVGAALRCDNYLDALFVNKKYRNQKIGSKLIERLL